MLTAVKKRWNALIEYTSVEHFTAGASMFRIVAALGILYQCLIAYGQRHYLYGPDGVFAFDLFESYLEHGGGISLFAWFPSHLGFELVFHGGIVATALWLVGWKTRAITPFVCLFVWSVHQRFPMLWDGGDNLLQIVLIYACFANLSARWSVDASSATNTTGPLRAMVHNAAVLAFAVQIALLYGEAGLAKLGGETWPNGTALYYALRAGQFTWDGVSHHIYENSIVIGVLAYATLVFQIGFPFVLFLGRRLRVLWLVGGIGFHLGIMVMMGLVTFGVFMMAVDLMFITDTEYATARRWIAETRAWTRGRIARLFRGQRPVAEQMS